VGMQLLRLVPAGVRNGLFDGKPTRRLSPTVSSCVVADGVSGFTRDSFEVRHIRIEGGNPPHRCLLASGLANGQDIQGICGRDVPPDLHPPPPGKIPVHAYLLLGIEHNLARVSST